jgi:hypothetical protein
VEGREARTRCDNRLLFFVEGLKGELAAAHTDFLHDDRFPAEVAHVFDGLKIGLARALFFQANGVGGGEVIGDAGEIGGSDGARVARVLADDFPNVVAVDDVPPAGEILSGGGKPRGSGRFL